MVHWQSQELTAYLREAIRTWNSWTSHWRDTASFALVMLQPFYDLPTVLSTLRGQTVTNEEMVADLQYALLEPAAPFGTWTGTDQFTLAQLSTAIQRRRDLFLQQTGAVLTRTETLYNAPAASGRLALDESVLTVRRVAWRPVATQLLQPLLRTDEWAGTHYSPAWPASTQPPSAYSVTAVPPITLQMIPTGGGAAGTLDLVSVSKGSAVNPVVSAPLGVPDDWAWVIKFGALADLLQGDGLALDAERAAYCTKRWEQGIQQATSASVVLDGRINDQPVVIASLADADVYSPLWQLLGGSPTMLIIAGQTLLASTPPAGGGGPYTVTLDVVRNAPVPSADGDILEVGQDIYDAILDYTQHLALFKEGAGQLQTAIALLNRAMTVAGIDLDLQQASQPDRRPLMGQTLQDSTAATPRALPAVSVP